MKKLHILIPSLVIASTLPALTIISCSKQKIGEWRQSDGEFKWVHDTPTFSVSEEQATNEYFNRVNKNVFADDIVKSRADLINSSDYSSHFKNWMISVEVSKIDRDNNRCSLTIHESGDSEIWLTNDFTHSDYTITLVDIPFAVSYFDIDNYWGSNIDGIAVGVDLSNAGKWVLSLEYWRYDTWSFSVKGAIFGTEFNDTINHDCLNYLSDQKHQDTLEKLSHVQFISSFFKNVTVQEG